MKKYRHVIAGIVAVLLFAVISFTAGNLLMPSRTNFGSTWGQFLEEDEESVDVLFFGSSICYCDVIPALIWEETGLTAYVMGGPEQNVPTSYYYIREACKTQSPQLIVLEMTGMFFPKYISSKINIGYMPMGVNRLAATATVAEPEERFGLIFPLYNYHFRWQEAGPSTLLRRDTRDINAGYTLLTDTKGVPEVRSRPYSTDSEEYQNSLEYLKRIKEYCDKEGIQLLCYFAPWMMTIPDEAREGLLADTEELGIPMVDLNDKEEEMGIDHETDWYDFLHLNVYGAEKLTRWMADHFRDHFELIPGNTDQALWQSRLDHIYAQLTSDG